MVGSESSNEERGPLRSLLTNAFNLTQNKYPRLARALKKVGTVRREQNCFCSEETTLDNVSYSSFVPSWQTTANNLRWAGFQNSGEVWNSIKPDPSNSYVYSELFYNR